ncbi:M23 family metallopeptidase [Actinoplanes sp. TRM 88003]|uniref:M23 family metallopeptidase n=1 Tax=Paractinoplanes aksuensis TaxID=2939490 RepID=A0ABT1E213_9ACTN|nr:peptidoglycan DD-metalloendopeptidase family protein [Actinoplanes aksuensis]MCO8277172.1 M23 family metallopeptidase [Actinoplanes aksuensis]
MVFQAETRSAGQHRREQAGRHRAPRTLTSADLESGARSSTSPLRGAASLTSPLRSFPPFANLLHSFSSVTNPLRSDRGRAVLLTAALASALVTGVAGGTAAAAVRSAEPVAVVVATPAPEPETTVEAPVAPWKPPASGAAAGAPRKVKPRALAPVKAKAKTQSATGWVNPMPSGRVTSCYGQRWGRLHAGVDIAAPHGTPILAAGHGVVVRAGEAQGYGLAVLIDHGNGYLTHYGHMSAIAVQEGQHVEAGEQIGDEGSTGHSTGPHLHFEVHQGFYKNPIEPTAWLRERGVPVPGCD